MKQISFQEKKDSPVGKRVRAVGMVYFRNEDLIVGKMYSLKRQQMNPKDPNCVELVDRFQKPRAVLNRDVASMISPLLDENKIMNAECEVIEKAKWSRGDSQRPARAHRIRISISLNDESDSVVKVFQDKLQRDYELFFFLIRVKIIYFM
ncbi:hypothetical protein QZH41_014545 [Actinostola sp. cb2023]|nr:hypothetical protein QZH41_014545 [Actinostola sp. cb2023]